MDIDPHTIQQLLGKVQEHLRCPQCTHRIDVRLEGLKVMGETFAVFQLKCMTCGAHILLHATITGMHRRLPREAMVAPEHAIRMTVDVNPDDLLTLRAALKEAGGSFTKLFQTP